MKFEITADNQPYLEARGKIVLNACPGSGKTTAIAYKLTHITTECDLAYGPFAGIACLSFTNVAKEEIGLKFSQISGQHLGYPHIISTIDSFINHYITLPYYYLLNKPSKRPIILNTVSFINDMALGNFINKKKQPLRFSYPPSDIKIEIDGSYSWKGKKTNPSIVDPDVFTNYCKAYKKWQFERGYLDNEDSTYIACYLLGKHPDIAKNLVQRFPYIVIDEAQDTSEIQYKIFEILVKAGLNNIELVGDPSQSLYEFREARPDLFMQRFNDAANWQPLRFNSCRRSSQRIINMYSKLRSITEAAISSSCLHESDHPIKIIRYDVNDLNQLIDRYGALIDPTLTNYILVRGATHLERFGVKAVSENPWKSGLAKSLIEAETYFNQGNTKLCIDTLRIFLASIEVPDQDHKTQREHTNNLKTDINVNIKLFEFIRQMPSIDDTIINWTTKMTAHILDKLNVTVDLQLKQKKEAAYYQQNIKALLYPPVNTPFPVSTIHKIKGKTFTSVLLVLSENSTGANISIADFIQSAELPEEKQRMIYVALSRPECLCCIAIPDSFSEMDIVNQLGDQIEFV
jgi:superfamily I DNA/RNA helicase